MKKRTSIFLTVVILIGFAFSYSINADTNTDVYTDVYKVMTLERVVDGDTFYASEKKIRLWGIDAPEKHHPSYLASKMLLEGLVKEGELKCKQIDRDKYQRYVMHCTVDGLDIGSMMVQTGMAKDFKKYSGEYYSYEQELAKAKKIGLWRNPTSGRF